MKVYDKRVWKVKDGVFITATTDDKSIRIGEGKEFIICTVKQAKILMSDLEEAIHYLEENKND